MVFVLDKLLPKCDKCGKNLKKSKLELKKLICPYCNEVYEEEDRWEVLEKYL